MTSGISAEAQLQQRLKANPNDAAARKELGDLCFRQSRYEEAEEHLARALQLVPDLASARWNLAGAYAYRGRWELTLAEVQTLLQKEPREAAYLDIEAYALLQLGHYERAIAKYGSLVADHPTAENWKSYGRALKAIGRTEQAVTAYRQALALKPDYSMVWWSLTELKTFRFGDADVAAMRRALDNRDQTPQNRTLLNFTLGRVFEDRKQYEIAFEHWRKANATMRSCVGHDPGQRAQFVQRNKSVFTPEYFRARAGWGSSSSQPIFVVGLPRSGSTLLEQILASHSQIEATAELQSLESVVRDLAHRAGRRKYPEILQELTAEQARDAGEEYMARSGAYRRLNRPFFVDKMPNNFSYIGAILTFLPNARIIDVRRHPLGSGLAIYKHYFVEAYSFAFDLADIGDYYRRYVELMAHFDAVQPGRVHRVFYENLIADPEGEIRRLLSYCGLPFEAQCVRFYENERPVLTPSSEQVRRPISADAALLWQNYDRWLEPLRSSLGDLLSSYPEPPVFNGAKPDV